jgi:hypothetical protein
MVEMAAMGFALSICPARFWEPLSQVAKYNLVRWLGGINDKDMPDSAFQDFFGYTTVSSSSGLALVSRGPIVMALLQDIGPDITPVYLR